MVMPAPPRRARRLRPWGAGALVLVVVAALSITLGWSAFVRYELDKVTVAWAGGPVCSGTTARGGIVAAQPGMACHVVVTVSNRGRRPVVVRRLIAPGLGPGSAFVVVATPANGQEPMPARDGLDAVYSLDLNVKPGTTAKAQVSFELRPGRCGDGVVALKTWPTVLVAAGGHSRSLAADETLMVRERGRQQAC
jgi:hypothetical protein